MEVRKQGGYEKLQIVLRGLAEKASVAEICNENGITQGIRNIPVGKRPTLVSAHSC